MQRTIRQVLTAPTYGADGQVQAKRLVVEPGHWADFDPFLLMAEDWFCQPGGHPQWVRLPHRG